MPKAYLCEYFKPMLANKDRVNSVEGCQELLNDIATRVSDYKDAERVICMPPRPQAVEDDNAICLIAPLIYSQCFRTLIGRVDLMAILSMLRDSNPIAIPIVVLRFPEFRLSRDITEEVVSVFERSKDVWLCVRSIDQYRRLILSCDDSQVGRLKDMAASIGSNVFQAVEFYMNRPSWM